MNPGRRHLLVTGSLLKKSRWLPVALLVVALVFALGAPCFLDRRDTLAPADAVVLYVGPEREERMEEARRLLREGYARFLIVPAHGEAYRVEGDGSLSRIVAPARVPGNLFFLRKAANYKGYYENTHVETLEARRIMQDLGLRSALLVSSPYHMRRIGLIAGRAFAGDGRRLGLAPSRGEIRPALGDWLDPGRRRNMLSEYVKLAWFICYAPFGTR